MVKSLIEAIRLYLLIKSQRTAYDLYKEAKSEELKQRGKLLEAHSSEHVSDDLVKLLRAELRESASIRATARDNLGKASD